MRYNFNKKIDRSGTNSVKWEFMVDGEVLIPQKLAKGIDQEKPLLSLWVADMDFRSPKEVIDAMTNRAKQGIFGYTAPTETYYAAVVNWMKRRHNWDIKPQWTSITPGVIPGLNMLIRTFLSPGDSILIQPPVYHPFYHSIESSGCRVARNPLLYQDSTYKMDFEDLERTIIQDEVKMAILCHPHNPIGRVWQPDELKKYAEICLEHEVLIVSDEIHGDLIYEGIDFAPLACISETISERIITCTAPSKTFNLAGLKTSNIVIQNETLRTQFNQTIANIGVFGVNPFGLTALQAAYEYGEDWLTQVMAYIEKNYFYLEEYIQTNISQIQVVKPEGTYLVWLDCRGLGLDDAGLYDLFFNKAGVYLDDGYIFGPEGAGFQRINIACPRSTLSEALKRIKEAVDHLPE